MKYVMLLLFVGATSLGQVYQSEIPAQATFPFKVDGNVLYREFKSRSLLKPNQMMEICVLQHGLGFDQEALFVLSEFGDKRINELLVAQPPAVGEGLNPDVLTFVAYAHFSEELITKLLEDRCRRVIVPFMESNQSNIFEMTRRTERFLKYLGCGTEKMADTRGCAYFGHGKAGVVASNLVRGCMSRESGLGQDGCKSLSEVYSASSINEGAGATAVLLGLQEAPELDQRPLLNAFSGALQFLSQGMHGLVDLFDGYANVDLIGRHEPGKSNPVWWDVSPLSYLEGTRRLSLAYTDFAPRRMGFFEGEFAASGGEFDFSKGQGTLSCGAPLEQKAQPLVAPPRTPAPAPAPQRRDPRDYYRNRSFMRNYVAPLVQSAKEVVKETPAVKGGVLMQKVRDRFCALYNKGLAELHLANAKRFYEAGRAGWDAMIDPMDVKWASALKPFTWASYQITDGFAERFTALGACERGLAIKGSGVTSCKAFKNLNHLATAGIAPEATLDIWQQLAPASTTALLMSPSHQPDPLKAKQPAVTPGPAPTPNRYNDPFRPVGPKTETPKQPIDPLKPKDVTPKTPAPKPEELPAPKTEIQPEPSPADNLPAPKPTPIPLIDPMSPTPAPQTPKPATEAPKTPREF